MKPCCKDCKSTTRKLIRQGPRTLRCATCIRERKKAAREKRHGDHVEKFYGLTEEEYQTVLEYQGGTCAGCGFARGIRKRMAVDHDHVSLLLRSILCGTCNSILARARNKAETLRRLADTLENSTVTAALGEPRYANPVANERR